MLIVVSLPVWYAGSFNSAPKDKKQILEHTYSPDFLTSTKLLFPSFTIFDWFTKKKQNENKSIYIPTRCMGDNNIFCALLLWLWCGNDGQFCCVSHMEIYRYLRFSPCTHGIWKPDRADFCAADASHDSFSRSFVLAQANRDIPKNALGLHSLYYYTLAIFGFYSDTHANQIGQRKRRDTAAPTYHNRLDKNYTALDNDRCGINNVVQMLAKDAANLTKCLIV